MTVQPAVTSKLDLSVPEFKFPFITFEHVTSGRAVASKIIRVWHNYGREFWNDFIKTYSLPNEAAIKEVHKLNCFQVCFN